MRSKRFEPIREIVALSAQDLSKAMSEAGRRVADLERQRDQLKTYREEYTRTAMQGGGAMDAVKLQNYRAFLERLGEALRQQDLKLDGARGEYERRRQQWSAKRVEAESLGRAIERFRTEELQCAERREQRDGDDAAQRIALARSGSGNS
jgi:flagellar FliJ protein